MIFKTLPILAAAASLAAMTPAYAQGYHSDEGPRYAPTYEPDYAPPAPVYEPEPAPTVGEVGVIAPDYQRGNRRIRSVPVYFADLDLNSRDGGYTLLTRIRGAARNVCSPAADIHDLAGTSDFQRCVRRAVNHAVNDVGAPSVQDAFYDLGVGGADLPD